MTISAPNNDRRLVFAMRWLIVGIVVVAAFGIMLNTKMASLKQEAVRLDKFVTTLKTENVALKNTYYSFLDTRALVAAAERLGYVRDSNPAYITFNADGSVGGTSVSLR